MATSIHKHDVEENWQKAINFTPAKVTIIVYDVDKQYDYERIKIGDGLNNVNDLPFVNEVISCEFIEILCN